jgi:hypothetical protein
MHIVGRRLEHDRHDADRRLEASQDIKDIRNRRLRADKSVWFRRISCRNLMHAELAIDLAWSSPARKINEQAE